VRRFAPQFAFVFGVLQRLIAKRANIFMIRGQQFSL
jgi:hypothetical protein